MKKKSAYNYSWLFVSVVALHLHFPVWGFNQLWIVQRYGIYYWKKSACRWTSVVPTCIIQEMRRMRIQFSSVQSFSRVRPFATPWIAARHASLCITNSQSSLRLTSMGVGDGQGGVLRFMGSQRVGHDWVTELNWTELNSHSPHFLRLIYLVKFVNSNKKNKECCSSFSHTKGFLWAHCSLPPSARLAGDSGWWKQDKPWVLGYNGASRELRCISQE